jgi:hypothetical protein
VKKKKGIFRQNFLFFWGKKGEDFQEFFIKNITTFGF